MEYNSNPERYVLRGFAIIAGYEVYQNEQGCYMAKVTHRKHESIGEFTSKGNDPEDFHKKQIWRTGEFPLNGPGKSKLKKKLMKFLYWKYRDQIEKY